ncbi:MAG: hypothetical protein GKS06_12960 [Acidobacteria bacterium]|nr:hypothetical protein [Acidobacteriota bacterium]
MQLELGSVMMLLILQLSALAWRVHREVAGNEPRPFAFVPVPDNVNILAMISVVYFCVIAPLTTVGIRLYSVTVMGRAVFVAALILLIVHPIVVASHYQLWRGKRDLKAPGYCTRQELLVQAVGLTFAGLAFLAVLRAANQPLSALVAG